MSQKPNFYSQLQFPPRPPIFPNQPPGSSSLWGIYNIAEPRGAGGYGPWEYAGRLYMLTLTKQHSTEDTTLYNAYNFFNVYRSDDLGVTWTCKDPDGPHWGLLGNFDPAGRITVLYLVDRPPDPNLYRYELRDFDLATDTWGEPYGMMPDWSTFMQRVFFQSLVRSNGNTAVIFEADQPDHFGFYEINLTEWTGTAWTTPFRIDYPEGSTALGKFLAAKLEPVSGNIHFFYTRNEPPPLTVAHRVIRPDNTLGPVINLRVENFTFRSSNDPTPIAFFKDKVYYFRYDSTVVGTSDLGIQMEAGYIALVGTPASEPTAFVSVPVSGPLSRTTGVATCPVVTPDGSKMHNIYGFDNPYNPGEETPNVRQFLRSETANGTDWVRSIFFDLWPQDARHDGVLSGLYLGSGGVDGIGMLAQTGPGIFTNTYFMVKNAGMVAAKASEGAFGNAVF